MGGPQIGASESDVSTKHTTHQDWIRGQAVREAGIFRRSNDWGESLGLEALFCNYVTHILGVFCEAAKPRERQSRPTYSTHTDPQCERGRRSPSSSLTLFEVARRASAPSGLNFVVAELVRVLRFLKSHDFSSPQIKNGHGTRFEMRSSQGA